LRRPPLPAAAPCLVTTAVYTSGMSEAPSLRVVVLGSGSGGNAVAVTDGATTLLVDCGFSAKETARRMAIVGLDAARVSAVLVTHEHSDHIRGVEVFARRHGCAVYATRGTRRAAGLDALAADVCGLTAGEQQRIGSFSVVPFRVSHDAAEPVGFRFEADCGERYGMATDTGVLTAEAAEALRDVDILGLESNHDLSMLANGPYPGFLKARIRSDQGHLSNPDAAAALELLASSRLRRFFALHRSGTNNSATIVKRALVARSQAIGLNVPIDVARQDLPLDSAPPQGVLCPAEKNAS
jgi:phosphoribosyl 1,2-cyclic phosphodiesterase